MDSFSVHSCTSIDPGSPFIVTLSITGNGGENGWTKPGTTTTVEIDLTGMSCGTPDLGKLQGMYVWFRGGGTFYIDNVRAE